MAIPCIYCGNTGGSKEHPYGKWSRGLSPFHYVQKIRNNHEIINYPPYGDPAKPEKGKLNRPGAPRSQTLRVVCEPCNNGWMSEIQEDAKSMLTKLHNGDWSGFTPEEQARVANWAALFTMTNEFNHPEHVVIPQSERDLIRESRSLSSPWNIAVGKADFEQPEANIHRWFSDLTDPSIRAQLTVWDFGHVFFATYFGPEDESSARCQFAMVYEEGMESIFPSQNDLVPPSSPTKAKGSWEMCDRISSLFSIRR